MHRHAAGAQLEFKGSSKRPTPEPKATELALCFLQGSSLEELDFGRLEQGGGGGSVWGA